jgi:hypothetical protein
VELLLEEVGSGAEGGLLPLDLLVNGILLEDGSAFGSNPEGGFRSSQKADSKVAHQLNQVARSRFRDCRT